MPVAIPGLPCSVSPFPRGSAEPGAGTVLSQGLASAWKALSSPSSGLFVTLVSAGPSSDIPQAPLLHPAALLTD